MTSLVGLSPLNSGTGMSPEEFDLRWKGTRQTVRAFIWGVLKDNDDADDVEMETAIALFMARHRYIPGRSFERWALTTGVRKALNALRDRNRDRLHLISISDGGGHTRGYAWNQSEVDFDRGSYDPGFNDMFERAANEYLLDPIIAQAWQRKSLGIDLALRVYSGETYADLMVTERATLGAIKSRIHCGMATMRAVASEQSYDHTQGR